MNKTSPLILALVLIASMVALTACNTAPAATPAAAPTQAPAAAPTTATAVSALKSKKVCHLISDSSNSFPSALTEFVKKKFTADGVKVLISGAEGVAQTLHNIPEGVRAT